MKEQNNTLDRPERWVPAQVINPDGSIDSFPCYIISDHGRVASMKGNVMKILKPGAIDKLGHLQVRLYVNSKKYCKTVHRIVLSSFCPEGWSVETSEVDHIDRDPTNNCLENLHWVSHNENDANRGANPLKKIRVIYLDDGHAETFDNMMDCSRTFGKSLKWCITLIRQRKGFHKGLNIIIEKI